MTYLTTERARPYTRDMSNANRLRLGQQERRFRFVEPLLNLGVALRYAAILYVLPVLSQSVDWTVAFGARAIDRDLNSAHEAGQDDGGVYLTRAMRRVVGLGAQISGR